MTEDQRNLVNDLRRRGQFGTADRVAALGGTDFQAFKRDLLCRFAADGHWRLDVRRTMD